VQGSRDQSPNRQNKLNLQRKSRNAINNGTVSTLKSDAIQSEMEFRHSNLQGNSKVMICLISGYS